jgi:hypothetical protein
MITIHPIGGLCNYLRVLFSYYEYATSINSELNVIWIKTKACPGYFLDYFEPIPNVNFIENNENPVKIDYHGQDWLRNFPPKYDKLKLKPYLEKIVFDKLDILNKNYISVHIRRTDHIRLSQQHNAYTDDGEFIHFIDKYDNKNIYIATDNEITYNKFKEKYPNQIKFDYHKTNENCLRHTSLQDAIVDIYMCVYSDDFMGSGWSSFSGVIKNLRKL